MDTRVKLAPGLLKEAKLSFQRKIKTLKTIHSVPEDLILNFDQTPLSYVCSASHALHKKGKECATCGKGKKEGDYWNFHGNNVRSFPPGAANLRR